MIILKSPHEIEYIRQACKLTADTLTQLIAIAKPGITTLELDEFAEEYIRSHVVNRAAKVTMGIPQLFALRSTKRLYTVSPVPIVN